MILTNEKDIRLICQPVEPHEVDNFRSLLEKELSSAKDGIGLALPQLGIAKSMAIVRIPQGKEILSVDLVNPLILNQYDSFIFDREGCLSFPDMWIKSKRYREIHVKTDAHPHTLVATNLLAVAIQHEMDHLIGRLLPDIKLT